MKKQLLSFLLLASCSLFAQTWTEQNTAYPVDGSYTGDISIVDANTVWTMVQRTSTTNHKTFSKTINGGTNWTSGAINAGSATAIGIGNISAVSATTAWVSAFPTGAATTGQGVYKTVDGGTTWTRQTTANFGTTSFANFVHFWDANNGVCGGDKQGGYFEIYTTTNGGTTWTRTPSGNIAASSGDYGYTGKFYVRGNTIWVGTDAGELLKSTNKGLNWRVITTPITDFGGGTDVNSSGEFAFKDDNNGVIQQTVSNVYYVTSNGGANWTTVPTTGMFWGGIDYAGNSLVSVGSTTGNFGSSYSNDNGATWTAMDGLSHTCVKFLDATTGWSGGFYATATGGGTFKLNGTLGTTSFETSKSSIFPNPTNGLVTIALDNAENFEAKIIDLNGKVLLTKTFNSFENNLDISSLANGMYLMELKFSDKREVKKIVKN